MTRVLSIVLVSILWADHAAADKLDWYLQRGRENMEIQNYQAAIEAFEKALTKSSEHREAMHSLALAYEKSGLIDKAVTQYDRYLAVYSDDATAFFKQAGLLSWERYAYRRKDAVRYYAVGLKLRDDLAKRHAYAKLLAADKSTLKLAIGQFEILIERGYRLDVVTKEYRKLLQWDPAYVEKSIAETKRQIAGDPSFARRHELARALRQRDDKDEAIDLYAELVSERPNATQLRHEYARLLAQCHQTEQAKTQYEWLRERKRTYEIRLEYADILAQEEETRAEAMQTYESLLKQRPDDTQTRLKYAQLLGAERDSVGAAIAQYRKVLASKPRSAVAHRGLAKAYAWKGERDRAVRHARLASVYGGGGREFAGFRAGLERGREPLVGGETDILIQPGGFGLYGFVLGAVARLEPVVEMTLELRAGASHFWNGSDAVSGGYATAFAEYRLDSASSVRAALGYYSLRTEGIPLTFEGAYQFESSSWRIRPGIERRLRYDSFVSLVGTDPAAGTVIGAARDNLAFVELERSWDAAHLFARAQLGFVTAVGTAANETAGAHARMRWRRQLSSAWSFDAGGAFEVLHYWNDHASLGYSTVEPLPGGYFSPKIFLSLAPFLGVVWQAERAFEFRAEMEPAVQYYSDATRSAFQVGFTGRLSHSRYISERLYVTVGIEVQRVADVYMRYQGRAALHWLL